MNTKDKIIITLCVTIFFSTIAYCQLSSSNIDTSAPCTKVQE
jgi:hypothetical protein